MTAVGRPLDQSLVPQWVGSCPWRKNLERLEPAFKSRSGSSIKCPLMADSRYLTVLVYSWTVAQRSHPVEMKLPWEIGSLILRAIPESVAVIAYPASENGTFFLQISHKRHHPNHHLPNKQAAPAQPKRGIGLMRLCGAGTQLIHSTVYSLWGQVARWPYPPHRPWRTAAHGCTQWQLSPCQCAVRPACGRRSPSRWRCKSTVTDRFPTGFDVIPC